MLSYRTLPETSREWLFHPSTKARQTLATRTPLRPHLLFCPSNCWSLSCSKSVLPPNTCRGRLDSFSTLYNLMNNMHLTSMEWLAIEIGLQWLWLNSPHFSLHWLTHSLFFKSCSGSPSFTMMYCQAQWSSLSTWRAFFSCCDSCPFIPSFLTFHARPVQVAPS